MAPKTVTRETSKGTCNFCKSEIDKSKMTQHLKFCKPRTAVVKSANSTEPERTRLFHIIVEGYRLPEYWMHLEVPADATLGDLDDFLRAIWLECCDHLSAFTIGKISYSSQREDMFWDYSYPGAAGESAEEDEDEEEDEEDQIDEIEVEPAELADMPFNELAAKVIEMVTAEFQADPTTLSLDEVETRLVQLLTAKLPQDAALPPEFKASTSILARLLKLGLLQSFATKDPGFGFESRERDMDVELGEVLTVGQKFSHEYDFGSTTELALKIAAEREGVLMKDEDGEPDPFFIMARNELPVIPCRVCGKPATKIAAGYYYAGYGALCDSCAKKPKNLGEFEDSFLPIVNSPRVGVCGYTGPYDPSDWEEEEYEDDEEEDEETD